MKVKEIVYMILDELKMASDDSFFNEDHIIFLCKKYRSLLIKKEQDKNKIIGDISSDFEIQEICLDLEEIDAFGGVCWDAPKLRTTKPIPKILDGYKPRVHLEDYYYKDALTFVSRDKMKSVGNNPYLKNLIYASIGPDLHLYLTSSNLQFIHLKKLRISAIFEDFDLAAEYLCDRTEGESCDILEADFPLRDYLVPPLVELVVRELSGLKYQPRDEKNNANDDLSHQAVKQ